MGNSDLTYEKILKQNKLLKEELELYKSTEIDKDEDSTNMLLEITNNIPAYIAVVDAKTLKYKFVNTEFTTNFDKTQKEIIGAHISDIIGKENTKFAMQFIDEVKHGKSTSYINTFDLVDGKKFAKVNYSPRFNNNGEVTDIIVLTYDITAIKQTEEELKRTKQSIEESEKRFKALHNASFGGIAIHDKGFIIDCNQGLADMTGYTANALIGMNGLLLIAEDSRDEVMNYIISGYQDPYEVFGQRKNGEKYPIRIEARNIPYKGKTMRVTEFRDITLQKNNEQKLLEQKEKYALLNEQLKIANKNLYLAKEKAIKSEEQLKLISNNFVNGMIYQVVTIDENNRKFTYVSDAVHKLYGCSPEEAFENPNIIYGKIHSDDISGLVDAEKEAIKTMSVFKIEARVINPDGSTRWSYFVSKPRIIDELVHWDGLEFDITDRKKMEQDLLKAKNKAEEHDHLKSAFLANMSHEIRTPMNSILGFSDLLQQEDLTKKEQDNYLKFINQGGKRLLTIISDIVDVSKIDANQLSLKIDNCIVNNLMDSLYNQFLISNTNPDVTLIAHKGIDNKQCVIKTDSTRLAQILSNLLENALKFTEKGNIEFGYTQQDDSLLFYVKDSGIGIDQQYHGLIFDRFRQVNNDFSESGSGTGLGLSIVKGLVDLLKGKIWVESTANKGSTFKFTLPLL